MRKKIKNIKFLLKTTTKKWWAREPFRESAIIAYYAIFSLPGLLVVLMTISEYFLDSDIANEQFALQVSSTMGPDTAEQIQDMLAAAGNLQNSLWAAVIGIATIIIGATGVFVQFQKSLNTIWEVEADETKSGIWSIIRARLFSFGLIITIAFIMMISLTITAFFVSSGDWLSRQFSESLNAVIQVLNFLVSKIIIVLLFALMFKYFADAEIKWNHVWLGSIVTTLLFLLGIYGMSFYFGKADPGDSYGPAGSVILILLWVSYSSMIVFFGAEFTRVFAVQRDGNIPPDKNAVDKQEGETIITCNT